MVFNSLEFLIFYPAVLLMYFLAPQKWRWVLLLAASYYFYLSWNVELVFLIVFTTAVSYVSALVIEKNATVQSRGSVFAPHLSFRSAYSSFTNILIFLPAA